ncbi:hypothetical protein [Flavobacterium columnare]|uniref:hypothetical protein n=1 Tax=Flavobacterium columnare TaxID=996 RepID=UPI002989E89D|nr:hypothetical protein [Flavobacterium columnare]MCH4828966.1 hypothetical protein [Flavobacterium columnare]
MNIIFEGFKPLSDLSKELVVQTTSELNQYMIRYLIKTPDGDVLEKVKKDITALDKNGSIWSYQKR